MSRNGSGTYSLPEAAFVFDTVISETAVNSNFSDIAAALTASIAADGQTPITANLPMNSKKHTGLAAGSAAGDSANLGQVQAQAYVWCGTMTGTADAGVLTPSPAITAYAAGQHFRWIASANANTGAMTVAVSGLTTKALENDGSALAAGDHAANKMYEGTYDGTAFQITKVLVATATTLASLGIANHDSITVSAAGEMTNPTQPAFLATPASEASIASGNGTVVSPVVFGTEIFDQNADFASNTFTAPVTGKYSLKCAITMKNLVSAADFIATITTSNRTYQTRVPGPPDGTYTLTFSVIADMDASDTATVTTTVTGMAGDTADIDNGIASTWFSGILVA